MDPLRGQAELLRRQMVVGEGTPLWGVGAKPERLASQTPPTPFPENDVQAFQGHEEREGGGQGARKPPDAPRARGVAAARSFLEGRQAPLRMPPEAAGLKSRAAQRPWRGGGPGAQPGQTPVPTDPGAASRPGGPFLGPDVQDR